MRQDADQKEKEIRDREIMARKLAEWNDDVEVERGVEQYYRDRYGDICIFVCFLILYFNLLVSV
jgi:hypothetical protein